MLNEKVEQAPPPNKKMIKLVKKMYKKVDTGNVKFIAENIADFMELDPKQTTEVGIVVMARALNDAFQAHREAYGERDLGKPSEMRMMLEGVIVSIELDEPCDCPSCVAERVQH